MKSILLNPLTFWLRWLITQWKLEIQYRKKHLYLEYMVEIANCKFGAYNAIYKYARLQNVEFSDFDTVARNAQVFNTKMAMLFVIFSHKMLNIHKEIFIGNNPIQIFIPPFKF